ncbi:MAG: FlgD immunoglobulin-like domain containing protein [Gaiellales bacterium]
MNSAVRRRLAIGAAALTPLSLVMPALSSISTASAATSTPSYTWQKVIDNGGRANAICADPNDAGRMMGMGDVWGPHETLDQANTWLPRFQGASGIGDIYGRACAYSLKYPGQAYVGIGTLKGGGGYFGVINGWKLTRQSTAAAFGTNQASGAAGTTPRAVGNLIQVDYDTASNTEYIFALTNSGLQRSTDQGKTWTKIAGLPSGTIWKALELANDGSLYAASYSENQTSGSKLYHVTNPRTSASMTPVSGAPGVVDDMASVGSNVLIAAGPGGLYQVSGNTASKVNTTAFNTTSLDTIAAAGNVVVAATASHARNTALCEARSTDGGKTWTWQKNVKMTTLGTNRAYWLGNGLAAYGGNLFGASQIAIDPQNPNFVSIAGKGGFWATHDGGQTWYPAGNGAGGSEVSNIKVSPTNPNQITTNDVDWTGIQTSDKFASYTSTGSPGSFAAAHLTRSAGGHTYKVDVNADTITMDGQSIADDYAKAALANAHDLQVAPDGTLYVALYGGGVLKGTLGGSSQTATAPANTTAPSISGTAQVGQTLSVTRGTWTGSPAPTVTDQWQRSTPSGWTTISGATGSSYTLVSADQGATLRVAETATNSVKSVTANSAPTVTVTGASQTATAPSSVTAPSVSGAAQVGQALTVTKGTWNGSPAPSVSEQWQRNTPGGFVNITGATGSSYTLVSADQGATIRVIETATNSAGSATATSTATATVTAAPVSGLKATLNVTQKSSRAFTASFTAGQKSTVTITIVNSAGKTVRNRFYQQSGVTSGAPIWYAKDDSGKNVPSGKYTLKLTATANGNTATAQQTVTV